MQKTIYSQEYALLLGLMVRARLDAGYSQSALAKMLNKPQSFVSKYESGDRRLDIIEFLIITKALKQDSLKIFNCLLAATQ